MQCLHPVRLLKGLDPVKFPQGLEVPCGQCMSCRILRREEWSLRLLHESLKWDSCIFFTLTYDDAHLPENGSLVKSDLQKFFKRLRKALADRHIKYFACGEYGDDKGRPHYHVIMFGLDFLNRDDTDLIKSCWDKCNWNELDHDRRSHKKCFGNVEPASIRYVVGYTLKKVVGKEAKYAYDDHNLVHPYCVMSKGIGRDYCFENKEKILKDGYLEALGYKHAVPRYYKKSLDIDAETFQVFGRDREIEIVKEVIGIEATRDEAYMIAMPDDVVRLEEEIAKSNAQIDLNIRSRLDNQSRKRSR